MDLLSYRGEDSYAGWTILSFLGAGILTCFAIAAAAWNEKLSSPLFIGLLCGLSSAAGLLLTLWKVKSRKLLYARIGLFSASILPVLLALLFFQELFKARFRIFPDIPVLLLILFVLHSGEAVLPLIRLNQTKALSR